MLALADLKRKPPRWLLYQDLAPADYERVWPAAAGHDLHFQDLETWIKANYRLSDLSGDHGLPADAAASNKKAARYSTGRLSFFPLVGASLIPE